MTTLADYECPPAVLEWAAPIATLLDLGLLHDAEVSLAGTALSLVDRLERGELQPEVLDEFFALIDIYLTDQNKRVSISEAAQDLIIEGELFHHYGGEYGPDVSHFRALAEGILRTAEARLESA